MNDGPLDWTRRDWLIFALIMVFGIGTPIVVALFW